VKLKDFGEKRLISEIVIPMFKNGNDILGIGDDAAILDLGLSKDIVVSVDFVAEKLIAFEKGLMNFYDLGKYTATSNISDIVSMGAQPIALLLSMAMKEDLLVDEFKDFLSGARDLCRKFGVKIVGGDIGNATTNLFTGVALGVIEKGCYLSRSGFKEGDLVCTTGYIGLFSTALAYYLISKENKLDDSDEKVIIVALTKPEPKVWQSRLLGELGCCTACQDITDGFSETIHEMTQKSALKFRISENALPIHNITVKVAKLIDYNPIDICFGPGSGFELLFTVKRDSKDSLVSRFVESGFPIYIIGEVVKSERNYIINKNGDQKEIISQKFENFCGRDSQFIVKQMRRK